MENKYKIYTLETYQSGQKKCLTVKDGANAICTDIIISKDEGNVDSQIFSIERKNYQYIISTSYNSFVLDVYEAIANPKTHIIQYTFHGDNNQRWNFVSVDIRKFSGGMIDVDNVYLIQSCLGDFELSVDKERLVIDNNEQKQLFVLEKVQ